MEYCGPLILVDEGVNDSVVVISRTTSKREWLGNRGYVWNQYVIWYSIMCRSSICRKKGRLTLNRCVHQQRMILESQHFHQSRSMLVIGYDAKRPMAQRPTYSRRERPASPLPCLSKQACHNGPFLDEI